MRALIEFEVTCANDEESGRVFYASRTVELAGMPAKGHLFHLPERVTATCHNCFWSYDAGRLHLKIGLGSVEVPDFDRFFRTLRDEGFEVSDRMPLD